MVGGIAVAGWGQYVLLSEPEFALRGALLMAGGGLAFLAALLMGWRSLGTEALLDDQQEESAATPFSWGLRQQVGLAVGILGGLAGFFLNDYSHTSSFTTWGFLLWLAGLMGLVLAFWPPSWRIRFRLTKLHLSSTWVLVVLMFTLGLAAFLRFYDLDNVLKEMRGDHASVIRDIKLVRDGTSPIFFPAGRGREALFFFLGAGVSPFIGFSFLTIKVTSGIVGVLTVAATYFMTRELFGNRGVALIAAILISLSFWHIILSRLGFPVVLQPLTVAMTLAFLFRALKYNRSSDFVFAGLFLGLGLYTYGAARVVPLAVGLILIISLLSRFLGSRHPGAPHFLLNSVLLIVTALAVYAPLGRYALEQSDSYWLRSREVGIQNNFSLDLLANNVEKTFLMFNWQGGIAGIVNAPASAQLDYVTGAAFALGAGAMALFWLLRRRGLNAYVGLAFFVMLIPTIGSMTDSTISLPSPVRAAGVIPLVFAAAALPLYMGFQLLAKAFGRRGLILGLTLLGFALGLIGYVNYQTYFDDYADFNAFNSINHTEVATVFRSFEEAGGDLDNAYLKAQPTWINTLVLAIEMGDIDWRNAFEDIGAARDHALNPEAKLYVLHPEDGTGFLRLREVYPRGTAYKFESSRSEPGREFGFFVILVPAAGEAPLAPLPNTHPVR